MKRLGYGPQVLLVHVSIYQGSVLGLHFFGPTARCLGKVFGRCWIWELAALCFDFRLERTWGKTAQHPKRLRLPLGGLQEFPGVSRVWLQI